MLSELFTVSVTDGKITPLTALAWYGIASTVWFPDGKGLVTVGELFAFVRGARKSET